MGGEKDGIISEQQIAVKETLQGVYHLCSTKSLLLGVCSVSISIRVRVKGRHTWSPETRCHLGRKTAFSCPGKGLLPSARIPFQHLL